MARLDEIRADHASSDWGRLEPREMHDDAIELLRIIDAAANTLEGAEDHREHKADDECSACRALRILRNEHGPTAVAQ